MGLDSTGLTIPRMQDLVDTFVAEIRAQLGDDINTDPDSPLLVLTKIYAAGLSEVYELLQLLFDSTSPDAAQGAMLDNVAALVGVTRKPATYASGVLTLSGVVGTRVEAGKIVRSTTTGSTFVTLQTVTIGAGGTVDTTARAEFVGGVTAAAGEIDEIITPVGGWQAVTNAADFVAGTDVESDTALRIRREESLPIIGAATDPAIAARIIDGVDSVLTALVISNREIIEVDGRPPKSFEVIVWPDAGVDETAVTQIVFDNMAAGIEAHGDNAFVVTDEFGIEHDVKWSYAERVDLWVRVDVETTGKYPIDGDAQVEAAILAVANGVPESSDLTPQEQALRYIVGDGLGVGESLTVLKLLAAVGTVTGVRGADVWIDTVNPPVLTDDFDVEVSQIARLDSARVIINIV